MNWMFLVIRAIVDAGFQLQVDCAQPGVQFLHHELIQEVL